MILISGSSGFIGKELIQLFKRKKINFKKIRTKDIIRKKKIFFKNISVFIHLGFNFHRKRNANKSDNNLQIIKSIIKHAENYRYKIIFPSTASYKYFGSKKIISKKIYPFDKYSLSKINCENLLVKSFKRKKIDITILRIFNVYGKNQKKGWLIPDLLDKFLERNSKIVRLKYYLNTRDFIHVSDVVIAIFKTLNLKGFNILNIGTSKETKIIKIGKLISKFLKSNKKLQLLDEKSKKNCMSKANITLTKRKLNWIPKVKVQTGLKEIINDKIK